MEAGRFVVSNLTATGSPVVTLSNTNNSYTGSTTVSGGTLAVGNVGELGTGDGGIVLSGGTLQATGNLLFPLNPGGGSTQRSEPSLSPPAQPAPSIPRATRLPSIQTSPVLETWTKSAPEHWFCKEFQARLNIGSLIASQRYDPDRPGFGRGIVHLRGHYFQRSSTGVRYD